MTDTVPQICALCRRQLPLTRHHLIPRTLHGRKRIRRLFPRAELQTRILWVCRPCHHAIHRVLSEKALAGQFNTLERLRAHPEIRRFVQWVAAKPVGFQPKGGR